MTNRIHPLLDVTFKPIESEVLHYADGKLLLSGTPLKCLKIIDNRFKVFVDYGFKGNSRYANEKSDYYVIDQKANNALLLPAFQDYGSIVHTLTKRIEKETASRPASDFISDIKVLVLTTHNLVNDGWIFTQELNGNVTAEQIEENEKKSFPSDTELKAWILEKAEDF